MRGKSLLNKNFIIILSLNQSECPKLLRSASSRINVTFAYMVFSRRHITFVADTALSNNLTYMVSLFYNNAS